VGLPGEGGETDGWIERSLARAGGVDPAASARRARARRIRGAALAGAHGPQPGLAEGVRSGAPADLRGADRARRAAGAQALLAELWTRSPDGKTLTFHLRKNVLWHDGKPFTAEDVLFTIDAIRSGKVPSLWTGYLRSIDKVEAVGDHTVKVTYKETFGPDVASFIFGILPKHLFDAADITKAHANKAPVGTGPFKFTRWEPRRSIILDANDKYWGGRPYLDKVELVLDL